MTRWTVSSLSRTSSTLYSCNSTTPVRLVCARHRDLPAAYNVKSISIFLVRRVLARAVEMVQVTPSRKTLASCLLPVRMHQLPSAGACGHYNYYLLRLRSSCPCCWNTGRRVVSIEHDHCQCFMSVTATDTHFLQIFSTCVLSCLLGLPHLLLPPSGVQSITRLAGRDVGRRSPCPMNLLRLSATMSCRSPMPALDRSSSFVMW